MFHGSIQPLWCPVIGVLIGQKQDLNTFVGEAISNATVVSQARGTLPYMGHCVSRLIKVEKIFFCN